MKMTAMLAMTGAAALLAGCSSQGPVDYGAAPLTPKQMERLDRQLAGKVAGEPQNCMPPGVNASTVRVSDNILLYRVSRGLVYRNDLSGPCPGLERDNDIIVVQRFGSQTCDGDQFHLVDRVSGIRGPTCSFGKFVPYRTAR